MSDIQDGSTMNRVQSSGQEHDMTHTTSDDGKVPPTAIRESITTPQKPSEDTGSSESTRNTGDPALRVEREQPGANGAPAMPHAMDQEPVK